MDSVKILGIFISNDLKWNLTIADKASRAKSTLYLLKQVNRYCNQNEYQFLVKTLLMPILTYGYPAWCNVGANQTQELQKLLNIASRIGNVDRINLQPCLDTILSSIFRDAESSSHPLHEIRPRIAPKAYLMRRCLPAIPKCRTEKFRKHFVCSGTRMLHNINT